MKAVRIQYALSRSPEQYRSEKRSDTDRQATTDVQHERRLVPRAVTSAFKGQELLSAHAAR
jgi:hypothetical protein